MSVPSTFDAEHTGNVERKYQKRRSQQEKEKARNKNRVGKHDIK